MSETCNKQCGPEESGAGKSIPPPGSARSAEWLSVYRVPKMDCPSEERMIRMALGGFDSIQGLSFDLSGRTLEVLHNGEAGPITSKLATLGLGASLQDTREPDPEAFKAARSAGLIADSVDMFADAAVYGLALYAVGHGVRMQVRAAHIAGILQLILAIGVLVEVGRRFFFGSDPESLMMMAIAFLALIANVSCLLLISKHRDGGAHMKASWIFSANDVVINLGVILAGALVAWTGSNYPDLIIGAIVGAIVLSGARRILALKG